MKAKSEKGAVRAMWGAGRSFPIPNHILEASGRALTFDFLALLNKALAKAGARSGVTTKTVARRLGWRHSDVKRAFNGRDLEKLGLRQLAELFWAIDGSVLEFNMVPKPRPTDYLRRDLVSKPVEPVPEPGTWPIPGSEDAPDLHNPEEETHG